MTKILSWKQELILSFVFFGLSIVSSNVGFIGSESSIPGFFLLGGIVLLPLGVVEMIRTKMKERSLKK